MATRSSVPPADLLPVQRKATPMFRFLKLTVVPLLHVLFEHVNRCLQRGGVVALYPEGNYGQAEGEIMPFKKGFAHFAIDNHVAVLPVALSGTQDLWLRKTVRLIIGPIIETSGHSV